jgi:hypothetical protein
MNLVKINHLMIECLFYRQYEVNSLVYQALLKILSCVKVETVKRDRQNFLRCLIMHGMKAKIVYVNVILGEV